MIYTKEQLKALSNETFFDNDKGQIDSNENQAFNNALIDSMALKPTTGYVVYPGDGKKYPVKKINGVWYTVKNHESVAYADGLPITTWSNGSTAQYHNNTFAKYGKLYSWYVTQKANLCPAGWKVPTKDDFIALINFLGSAIEEKRSGMINVWRAVFGGYCLNSGTLSGQGNTAYYLSSSVNTDASSFILLFQNGSTLTTAPLSNKQGYTLRFIIEDESLIQYDDYTAQSEFESRLSNYLSLIFDMDYIDSDPSIAETGDLMSIKIAYNGAFIPELRALNGGVVSTSDAYGNWLWNNAISTNLGAAVGNNTASGIQLKEIRSGGNACFLEIDFIIASPTVTQVNVKLRSPVLNGLEQTKSIPLNVI
jgi:uncharacterized protein (TIGR02145 family)